MDFLYLYLKKHNAKDDYKHRDLIHFPIIYILIGFYFIFTLFGTIYATLFLLASLLHFIHDSIAIGWGIKWLFPFSRNNYAFFYLYSSKIKKGLRKLVFVFKPDELPAIVAEHGDKDWVKNIYFKWHPIALVEFLVFVVAMMVLIFKYFNW